MSSFLIDAPFFTDADPVLVAIAAHFAVTDGGVVGDLLARLVVVNRWRDGRRVLSRLGTRTVSLTLPVSEGGRGRYILWPDPEPPRRGDSVDEALPWSPARVQVPDNPGTVFLSSFVLPASPAYEVLTEVRPMGPGDNYGLERATYVTTGCPGWDAGRAAGSVHGGQYAPPAELSDRQRRAYFNGFYWGRCQSQLPAAWNWWGRWAGREGIAEGWAEAARLLGLADEKWFTSFRDAFEAGLAQRRACELHAAGFHPDPRACLCEAGIPNPQPWDIEYVEDSIPRT